MTFLLKLTAHKFFSLLDHNGYVWLHSIIYSAFNSVSAAFALSENSSSPDFATIV